jgi:hypothetical protein
MTVVLAVYPSLGSSLSSFPCSSLGPSPEISLPGTVIQPAPRVEAA